MSEYRYPSGVKGYEVVRQATNREARIIKFWLFLAFVCFVLAFALGLALTPWYWFFFVGVVFCLYISGRYGGLGAITTNKLIKKGEPND